MSRYSFDLHGEDGDVHDPAQRCESGDIAVFEHNRDRRDRDQNINHSSNELCWARLRFIDFY